MRRHLSTDDRWLVAVTGPLLLFLSVFGIWYAARAAAGAWLYRYAKYGSPAPSADALMDVCRKAHVWYPWNYYGSIVAAERAFRQSEAEPTNAVHWLRQSQWWCSRGLVQNPYNSQLRRLHTRFLWPESPAAATAYWAAHTDWHFWEPYNHAVLAELYAQGGDFERADSELNLIRSFVDYGPAKERVDRERQAWTDVMRSEP